MAENTEGKVLEFDPLQTPMQTNAVDISFRDVVKYISDGYKEKDQALQFQNLSDGITGLNNRLEKELFRVQNSLVVNQANTIRTLPLMAGREIECVSTIQPAAWITDEAGGMYDPVNDQIWLNCIGHWEGEAKSLNNYLWQSITTPCFIAFHIVAICSIIIGFLIGFLNPTIKNDVFYRTRAIGIIVGISVSYDIICVAVILFLESFFPDDPAPFEASQVQEQVFQVVNTAIESMAAEIPEEHKSLATNDKHMENTQLVGHYILIFFYETGKTVLSNLLKPTGIFSDKKVVLVDWPQFERFLSFYRFLREISDAEIQTYEPIPDVTKKKVFKSIIVALERGVPDVHFQILRLLALALEPPNVRSQHVEQNPADINLNHYLSASSVRSLIHDIKLDLGKWKSSKTPASFGPIENRARIEVVVAKTSDEQLVTFRSHSSRFSSSYIEFA